MHRKTNGISLKKILAAIMYIFIKKNCIFATLNFRNKTL